MLTKTRRREMFGTQIEQEGVRFRLWAPNQKTVSLLLGESLAPMTPVGNGWFELLSPAATAGTLYKFVLADGLHVSDPASRYQPSDVHGPSEVVDPGAYKWNDTSWRGPRVGGVCSVRASRRRVHPRGNVFRGDR
jgi:1,4-alpha-glucan branching enzyme